MTNVVVILCRVSDIGATGTVDSVDHVARVNCSLLSQIPGKPGGPFPVAAEELKFVLIRGSVANTIRGLAADFGITCGIIGAYGDDEIGSLFIDNISSYKVDLSRLRLENGHTAQCICLVYDLGNRTMRPCLASAVKVQANDLTMADLRGSQWLVLRYSIFNIEVIQATIKIAKQEGVSISLYLASFEMVRKFRLPLLQLLESGSIYLCFANEDEALELLSGEDNADPEKEIARVPSTGEAKAVDATGAGDLFESGFLYGLVKGLSLEECCKIGPENWQWM
ncbi:hypothetical protein DH2020_025137 [Rehmannia glutinosa]|uniref:Carbohydrate kinase PfkB domain-containing protein n=1 Tax=Rehmannia glutinosa TaxID=99300 RepID=A0ABR0W4F7_REHGL